MNEKATTNGAPGATNTQYRMDSCANSEGPFARQTFTFAKVFKDSRIGEAGVMLDIQQVSVPGICVSLLRQELVIEDRERKTGFGGLYTRPRYSC